MVHRRDLGGSADGIGRAASIGTKVPGFQLGDLESCRTALYRLTWIIEFSMTLIGWRGEVGKGVGGRNITYRKKERKKERKNIYFPTTARIFYNC
jgi:hypothetical protein